MIVSQELYAVKCNCCGELYEDPEGTYYDNETMVEEYAIDNNWIEYQDGHVCPNCYEIGDEDETVLLKPFVTEPEIKPKTDLERFKELFDSVGVKYTEVNDPDSNFIYIYFKDGDGNESLFTFFKDGRI